MPRGRTMFCRLREMNILEKRGHINNAIITQWNRYYAKLSWFIEHIGRRKGKPCSHFFCFKLPIRQHTLWANIKHPCICSWGVYLLPYLKPIPHCWETNVTSLPPRLQRCLVADRCLVFMNILCTARPRRRRRSFDLHFKRKFCLCHCQRLCVTHSAFAVVTCLFECSNRRATQSSSGLTVQGTRATLQIWMDEWRLAWWLWSNDCGWQCPPDKIFVLSELYRGHS